MRNFSLFIRFLLIAAFSVSSLPFFAQNQVAVQLTGTQMRALIEVKPGDNSLLISGLQPGNTYTVQAGKATLNQPVNLSVASVPETISEAQNIEFTAAHPGEIRFKAVSSAVSIGVHAESAQQVDQLPMFVSISCASCEAKLPAPGGPAADFAKIQVTPNISPQELISGTLIGGDCFTVTNITSSGNGLARGTFSAGSSTIGIDNGMVMATGNINILPGPNNAENANGGFGVQGFDPNLSSLVSGELYDVNVIEFDFVPTANTVQFDFVFGSEEYCEYVGTNFNDVFGFFISGPGISGVKNLAVIPGTGGIPVTTNNVNHITHSNYYVNNSTSIFDCLFSPTNSVYLNGCQLDGWTKPLTAVTTVVPCEKYHIKLAIADVTDHLYDSAVFLRANSFNAGGQVAATPVYHDNQQSAAEGCTGGAIRFSRGNSDLTQPLTVNYVVSPASTATPDVDYAALPTSVVIPAGQTEITLPVEVYADGIPEGPESIILLVSNSCQCQQSQIQFMITDNSAFSVQVYSDTTVCEGYPAILSAIPDGGISPYSFAWSSGDTTASIIVSPSLTTTYTVSVTDGCGETVAGQATVTVVPILRDTVGFTICAGDSIEINGLYYAQNVVLTDTSYSGNSGCSVITTYYLQVLDSIATSQDISFCDGDSVNIDGNIFTTEATFAITYTSSIGCDSIVTYSLHLLPKYFSELTVTFCEGDTIHVNGVPYSSPGFVADTLTSSLGCDSILIYHLVQLPRPQKHETIHLCPAQTVTLGGNVYTAPATVTMVLPATSGCDTVATYDLIQDPFITTFDTIRLCPGETVTIGGITYSQPVAVTITKPATVGCDTIATYEILSNVNPNSHVVITCPSTITLAVPSGASGAVANFNDATATSDCTCPGMDIEQTSGPLSGSTFPLGITQVCYRAQDACGNTQTCCFNVSVDEESPCDIKEIGCMKYELLTITQDQLKRKTYRIRVTNKCASGMIYTAIQTPNGLIAVSPANNSFYTAPSGNQYLVRNPNYAPFYSVRYHSVTDSIANGESDILKYTLPPQADVTYIHILSRLNIQQYFEAHLNTFYCPIGITPPGDNRPESEVRYNNQAEDLASLLVFPNPNDGSFFADLSSWEGEPVNLRVFNTQGQLVLHNAMTATFEPQRIDLPQQIAEGLYFLEVSTAEGEKEVTKFMVRH